MVYLGAKYEWPYSGNIDFGSPQILYSNLLIMSFSFYRNRTKKKIINQPNKLVETSGKHITAKWEKLCVGFSCCQMPSSVFPLVETRGLCTFPKDSPNRHMDVKSHSELTAVQSNSCSKLKEFVISLWTQNSSKSPQSLKFEFIIRPL